MKQWISAFFFILVSFFLEVSALSLYLSVSLPLSLMALIFCSIKYGELVGQVSGFVLGLLLDIVSGTPLGFYALSYLTVGFVLGLWHKEAFLNSWFFSLLLFVAARFITLVFALLLTVFFQTTPWELGNLSQGFLLGLLFCPLYMSFLNFLDGLFTGKRHPREGDF